MMKTSQRTIESVERALLEVGPPWRAFGFAFFGAMTHETSTESRTVVVTREEFLAHIREYAERHAVDARQVAMVRDIESRIEAHRNEIPHIIVHDGGTRLDFITPTDGANA